jgi:F-type H+-transporting ATPase subunit gamma
MSRRHDLEARIDALGDIGKIMRSMKNFSYVETRKLARFLDAQRRVVEHMARAASQLLADHPGLVPTPPAEAQVVVVLIGAERGFCGGFNEDLLRAFREEADTIEGRPPALIAVGTRLLPSLSGHPRLLDGIPGASTAEEVPAVLNRLLQSLERPATASHGLILRVLCWDAETDRIFRAEVLPPFQDPCPPSRPTRPFPPRLNLSPPRFLELLVDQYLFAALHALLYESLMAEHQHRLRHLQGASKRVEGRIRELTLRCNVLRQEEITEEIELILLSRATPATQRPRQPTPTPSLAPR